MANSTYDSAVDRFDFEDGPGGTQRQRRSDPTGEPMADVANVSRAETRMNQYRHGGWDKYEVPTGRGHPVDTDDLPQFHARGGNAGAGHNEAAYPGGTTA